MRVWKILSAMMLTISMAISGSAAPSGHHAQQAAGSGSPTQGADQAVTNADIVRMTAAHLSDEVVLSTIKNAKAVAFDVSPQALIEVGREGVSDRIIQAMQERQSSGARASLGDKSAAKLPTPAPPCRIFVTEDEPPSEAYIVVRKEVQVGKKFYGSNDDALMTQLATEADKAGADAIIKYHEWRAPSMWSWAAAKEGGMAVKWTPKGEALVSTMKGQCWSPQRSRE